MSLSVSGDLPPLLRAAGFAEIALSATGVGHLHARGELAGEAIEILIDTGASNTVVDRALARRLGLALAPDERRGGGVGDASVAIDRIADCTLAVGGVAVGGDLYAMDFSHIRTALEQRGVEPPSAVLGADALRAMDAVLLYRENSLFLRPR